MSEARTKPTGASVADFLGTIDEARRADADRLVEIMREATGAEPAMWGSAIVGFGAYHYRYPTGNRGDSSLVGFSPRKSEFSIYLTGIYFPDSAEAARLLLERLGRHRMGKACLYVRKLGDIDETVLAQLIELSVLKLRENYG